MDPMQRLWWAESVQAPLLQAMLSALDISISMAKDGQEMHTNLCRHAEENTLAQYGFRR